jgi:hypothetical protein
MLTARWYLSYIRAHDRRRIGLCDLLPHRPIKLNQVLLADRGITTVDTIDRVAMPTRLHIVYSKMFGTCATQTVFAIALHPRDEAIRVLARQEWVLSRHLGTGSLNDAPWVPKLLTDAGQ